MGELRFLKAYVGAKIIKACPAMEGEVKPLIVGQEDREGYVVIYPDGYQSWSPKATFEEAYRPISDAERRFCGGE
jgi:hypothetical protein